MTYEDKMLRLFFYVHGTVSGSCGLRVDYDVIGHPTRVVVVKNGMDCWSASREELLFDYVTMLFTEESIPV